MPLGTQQIYNPNDVVLTVLSSSGNVFVQTKLTASANSAVIFNASSLITSSALSDLSVGNADTLNYTSSTVFATTGSNIFIGDQLISGSVTIIDSGSNVFQVNGSNGTLLNVVDDLSDSLFSVNDTSGLPIFEIFGDDRIVAGQYGSNDFVIVNNNIGIGTNQPSNKLDVVGNISASVYSGSRVLCNILTVGDRNEIFESTGITLFNSLPLRFHEPTNNYIWDVYCADDDGFLSFDFSGSPVMQIQSYGAVDIGFNSLPTVVPNKLSVRGNISASVVTASLLGTASFANNAVTASHIIGSVVSASYALSASFATTSSRALNANSASNAVNSQTASYLTPSNNYTVTNLTASGNTVFGNGLGDVSVISGSSHIYGSGSIYYITGSIISISGSPAIKIAPVNVQSHYGTPNIVFGENAEYGVIGYQYEDISTLTQTNFQVFANPGPNVYTPVKVLDINGDTGQLWTNNITTSKILSTRVSVGDSNSYEAFESTGATLYNSIPLRLHEGANNIYWDIYTTSDDGELSIETNGFRRLSIDQSGNMVLGSGGVPAIINKLHVLGNISCSAITASTFFGTSSRAISSSWATNAGSAINADFAVSSTFGTFASTASYLATANTYTVTNLTASGIISCSVITSSMLFGSASFAISASSAISSSFATTSSRALNANSASYIIGSSVSGSVVSSSYALSASYALNIGNGVNTIAGTTNQISVNGGTSAVTGAVTLSLPANVNVNNSITTSYLQITGSSYKYITSSLIDKASYNNSWVRIGRFSAAENTTQLQGGYSSELKFRVSTLPNASNGSYADDFFTGTVSGSNMGNYAVFTIQNAGFSTGPTISVNHTYTYGTPIITKIRSGRDSGNQTWYVDAFVDSNQIAGGIDLMRVELLDGQGILQWGLNPNSASYTSSVEFSILYPGVKSAGTYAFNVDGAITSSGNVIVGGNVGVGVNNPTYKLHVSGSFAATTKSFIITHPTKPNKKLVYGSLESPYHGIRLTGKGNIKHGSGSIELPEYVNKLVHEDSITIHLTPIKCGYSIFVDDILFHANKFTVGCLSTGSHDFYWDFTAERTDIPKLITEI